MSAPGAEPRRPSTAPGDVASEWQRRPFFEAFGVEIEAIEDGYARIGVPRSAVPLRGVRDSLNGGVVASLADAAMQLCVTSVLEPGEGVGETRELSVSYLSSARGERTIAEARLLRRGRRLAVGDVEVRDASDGPINAKARVSCEILPPPAPDS